MDATAQAIMRNINAAAAVTPVNLIAAVLLATTRQVLPEEDLTAQIDLCLRLLRRLPYSSRVTVTSLSAAEILTYGGTLHALHVPDTAGRSDSVVLSLPDVLSYAVSPYFGALVGRYANRIAKGRFTLDDTTYTLAINNDPKARIFRRADYGAVGDLYEVVPALIAALQQ